MAQTATSSTVLTQLFDANPPDKVKRALARNSSTPPDVLALLAWTHDQQVRVGVAGNKNAPLGTVAMLTQDAAAIVRREAIANPLISPYLAGYNRGVDSPVGAHNWPQTTERALCILLDDGGAALTVGSRSGAHTCPKEVLAILAHSPREELRARIASSSNADAPMLDLLAKTSGYSVMNAVARNKNADASTLDVLGNMIVGRGQYAFNVEVFLLAQTVASSQNSAAQTLATLAKHGTRQVRRTVAANTRAPSEVLTALAHDDGMTVIERVSANPSCPPSALANLAEIGLGVEKRYGIGSRFNTPWAEAPMSELDRLDGDFTTWGVVLAHVSENPKTPTTTLCQLSEHGYDEYVARNPAAPPQLRSS